MPGIVAFVPQKFIVHPDAVHLIEDNTISVKDVFAGAEWFPTATPAAQFGFLPLIAGTLWVSLFAILLHYRSDFRFLFICPKWQIRRYGAG